MEAIVFTQLSIPEIKNLFRQELESYFSQAKSTEAKEVRKPATRQQAAEYLNITLPTLSSYTLSGKIQGQRIGRRVLYRWVDLDAALTAINTGGTK